MPSPNVPTLDSAVVFPGTVHVEGTQVSEGRGTTRPFELVGAPYIEAAEYARRPNRGHSGILARVVPALLSVFEVEHTGRPAHGCGGAKTATGARGRGL